MSTRHGQQAGFLLLMLSAALPSAHADLVLSDFSPSRPIKVMAIGDSITDDCSISGAWRRYLQPLLETNGYPFVFVGRYASTPTTPSFTKVYHEGHCGAVIAPPGAFAVHGYTTHGRLPVEDRGGRTGHHQQSAGSGAVEDRRE
jgi:hypothetical protein